jgi:hypothetical protein
MQVIDMVPYALNISAVLFAFKAAWDWRASTLISIPSGDYASFVGGDRLELLANSLAKQSELNAKGATNAAAAAVAQGMAIGWSSFF